MLHIAKNNGIMFHICFAEATGEYEEGMRWHPEYFISDQARRHRKKIMGCIRNERVFQNVNMIILSDNPHEQLEIRSWRPTMDTRQWYVVGVALGKDDALELVCRMTETVYRKTGTANLKEYFACTSYGQ